MRLTFLDGLRCLAVLAVVAQHFLESTFPVAAKAFLGLGPGVFGVALFFMISGYVIPFSLRHSNDWKDFFLRRAFRIIPMYWATLCLAFVLGFAGLPPYANLVETMDLLAGLSNALLAFEFLEEPAMLAVAWSLSLEIIWYILIFLLFCLGGQKQCAKACFAGSAILVIGCIGAVIFDQRLPFGRMLMLNAALLGYARYFYEAGDLDRSTLLTINATFLTCGAIALFVGFEYFEHPNVRLSTNLWAWIVSYLIFTTSCSFKLMRNSRLLNDAKIGLIGVWSYSIYLLHEPIKNVLVTAFSGWILLLTATLITLGLAALSNRVIELPGIRLGRSLSKRGAQRRPLRPNSTHLEPRKF